MREKRRALPRPLALLHTILILCIISLVRGIDHIHSGVFPKVHLRTTTIDTSATPIHEGFQQGSGRRLLSKHHCHTHHHRWGPLHEAIQALFSHQHGLSHDERHALVGHIESSGAKVVGSVPDNTLLVVGSGDALSQAANHIHLVWTGLFDPEHKIGPEWDAILDTVEEVHECWKRRGGFANATDAALQQLADNLPSIQAVPYHLLVSPSSLVDNEDEKVPPMLGIEVTFPQGWMAPPRPHAAGHHHALDVQTRAARILAESEQLHAGEAAKSDWEPLLRQVFNTKYIVVKGGSKDTAVVFASAEHVREVVEWLAERPSVHWVAPLPRLLFTNNQASSINQSGRSAPTTGNYNTNSAYYPFWSAGITGKDLIIGCGDSGIDRYHCNFVDPDVDFSDGVAIQDGYRTFSSETHRKIRYYKAFGDTIDHNGHGTHTANTLVGKPYGQDLDGPNAEYVGMAPDAKIAFLDLSNAAQGDVITAPYDLARDYFRLTWGVGARIHSDSWGSTSPTYTAQSAQVDAFCWTNQEFLPFFPSGNERGLASNSLGLATISSPATSKNCMAVGATLSVGDRPVSPASVVWTARADSSEGIDTEFATVQASFGGSPLPFVGQPTKLVLAEPLLGCSALKGNVQGAFVLVFRGDCFFSDKAANAQNAGAAGIIIYDNEQRPYVQAQAAQDISGGSGGGSITIPVLSTSRTDGQALTNEILAGRSLTVTLDRASSLSNSFEDLASYSSQGPTMDGRIKPDILAPGTITSAAAGQPASNSCSLSPLQLYARMAGTSMATPAAAGSAVLVRDYFLQGFYPTGSATPENKLTPSGALLKAVLVGGAQHLKGYDQVTGLPIEPSPSFRQGYGRLDLSKSLPLSTNSGGDSKSSKTNMRMVDMVDINTGESHQYCVRALGGPFTVTLVWHDYPSSVAAQTNLVNDLDLTVRAAGLNGIRMLGNGGDGRDSSQPDRQNNVEQVTMTTLPAGQVAIEVKAAQTYAAAGPQPYSLVITGDFSGEIRAPQSGTSSTPGVCPVVVAIIKSGPNGATSETPVFEIATQDGTGTGITFECKLTDMGGGLSLQGTHDWRECGSKVEYANIADGQYQFTVRGMGEELTSSQTFVYDTTPPALQLASDTLPANPTTLGIANIEFSAADSTAVNYQCKLSLTGGSSLQRDVMSGRIGPGKVIELAQWYNCTSPQDLRWLLPGSWDFEVQATDGVGNNSEIKRYPWSIAFEDAVSYVRLLSGPFGKVAGGDQEFEFAVLQGSAAAPAGGETECRIGIVVTGNGGTVNFGDWSSCSSPAKYAITKDDTYRFESRLKGNISGNPSTTAASVIQVDATPPTLTVEERPGNVLNNPTATFRFSLNEEGTTMCRLSPAGAANPPPLEACTSPMIYEGLADGGYVFTITAKDAVGNQAPSQDISFIVDSSPPVFTFISGPAAVSQGSVTVDWGVIDEGSGIQNVTCYFRPTLLANGQQGDMGLEEESVYNWQLCSPPATFTSGDGTGLQEGRYALTLRALDVGGLKTTTEDYAIFVDFTPPTVGLTKVPPTNKAVSSTVVLEFEDAAPGIAPGAGSNVTWNVFTTKQSEEEWMALRNGTAALEGGTSGNAGIQVLSVDGNNNRKLLQNEGVDTSIDQSNNSTTTTTAPANQQQPPSSLAPNQLGKDDLDKWANCTSPCTIKGLKSGYYAMQVRGTDDAGNQGKSSPIIFFNVDSSLDPDSGLPDWALYTIIGVSVAVGVIIIASILRCVYVKKRNKRLGIIGGNSRAQLNGPQGAVTTSDFASYSFTPSSGYYGRSAFDTGNGGGLNGSFTSPYASNPYGYLYTPPQVPPTIVGTGGAAVESQQMAYALAASQRGGIRVNGATDTEMRAAIQASLEEEQRRNRSGGVAVVGNDDEMLRAAIEASLREQQYQRNTGW